MSKSTSYFVQDNCHKPQDKFNPVSSGVVLLAYHTRRRGPKVRFNSMDLSARDKFYNVRELCAPNVKAFIKIPVYNIIN